MVSIGGLGGRRMWAGGACGKCNAGYLSPWCSLYYAYSVPLGLGESIINFSQCNRSIHVFPLGFQCFQANMFKHLWLHLIFHRRPIDILLCFGGDFGDLCSGVSWIANGLPGLKRYPCTNLKEGILDSWKKGDVTGRQIAAPCARNASLSLKPMKPDCAVNGPFSTTRAPALVELVWNVRSDSARARHWIFQCQILWFGDFFWTCWLLQPDPCPVPGTLLPLWSTKSTLPLVVFFFAFDRSIAPSCLCLLHSSNFFKLISRGVTSLPHIGCFFLHVNGKRNSFDVKVWPLATNPRVHSSAVATCVLSQSLSCEQLPLPERLFDQKKRWNSMNILR